MKLAPLLLLATFALGCGDDGTSGNPATLWLAPDQAETHVKLVGKEPDPY